MIPSEASRPAEAPGTDHSPVPNKRDNDAYIAGVRFIGSPRVSYFLLDDLSIQPGTWVVAESTYGDEAGRVVIAPQQILRAHIPIQLPRIERVMSDTEIRTMQRFLDESRSLVERAREIARQCNARVELRSARYSFDGSYVVIAVAVPDGDGVMELQQALEERFREPVRMRRVGTLPPKRLVGGLGISDRKHYSLSRENEQYKRIKEDLPRLGQQVRTDRGEGTVVGLQVFRGIVTVRYTDGGLEMTHTVTDLHPDRS